MKTTHIIIAEKLRNDNHIHHWKYIESKWERNLGEIIDYDGTKMEVIIIGENRNSAISEIKEIMDIQNKPVRDSINLENRIIAKRRRELLKLVKSRQEEIRLSL